MSKLAVNTLLKYADAVRRMHPLNNAREPASIDKQGSGCTGRTCLESKCKRTAVLTCWSVTRNRMAAAMTGCALVLRDALRRKPCPCTGILIVQAHGL